MRRLVNSKSDAIGLVFLALLLLGSAALVLLGYAVGLAITALLVGFLLGWVAAFLLTKPRRYHGWVAVALCVGVLLPFLVPVFGLVRGVEWAVLDPGFESTEGAFWFGVTLAVIQVAFGRFFSRGLWAED